MVKQDRGQSYKMFEKSNNFWWGVISPLLLFQKLTWCFSEAFCKTGTEVRLG